MRTPRRLLAVSVISALICGTPIAFGIAEAAVPAVTVTYAQQMHCKWREQTSMVVGGANDGVKCVVKNSYGRQDFYILKYRNIDRAVDAWKSLMGHDGYQTRKGHVLIISQGDNGRHGDWGYSLKWANYAARHVAGSHIIRGY